MSAPNAGEVNTSMAGEENHKLDGNEVEEISSAAASSSFLITSEEVARQIQAATGPSRKQLE